MQYGSWNRSCFLTSSSAAAAAAAAVAAAAAAAAAATGAGMPRFGPGRPRRCQHTYPKCSRSVGMKERFGQASAHTTQHDTDVCREVATHNRCPRQGCWIAKQNPSTKKFGAVARSPRRPHAPRSTFIHGAVANSPFTRGPCMARPQTK